MRYFPMLDFQYVVLLIFLGLAALVLLCVAFGWYRSGRRGDEGSEELEEYPEEIRVGNRPIPPILIFIYISFILWALGYLIAIGIRGGPF